MSLLRHPYAENTTARIEHIISNIEQVIKGKRTIIEHVLISLLCGGHILFEDVPGVGKTMLVRTIAKTIGCSNKRIQCTPDLLPSDVTGITICNPITQDFEYRPGPVFHHLVHVDELNRTSPKTQAAFLEAMEEGQVTVDGSTYELSQPFWVLATQNPSDHSGTYALPEAQIDRFFMKLKLGYPSTEDELKLLQRSQLSHPVAAIENVITLEQFVQLQQQVKGIHIETKLQEMIVNITNFSRTDVHLRLGASPRASIALMRAAQARAMVLGRTYVIPDDIQHLALPIMEHRLVLTHDAMMRGWTAEMSVNLAISELRIPIERFVDQECTSTKKLWTR